MNVMKTTGIVVIAMAMAWPAAGQDELAAARELYASASYEEALTALAAVAAGAPPEVAVQAHQYRAFSLLALGRTAEAEQVAETSIRLNPLARLNEAETSPRIASMFTAVRRRVLPVLVRAEYRTARAAIDRQDLKAAEPHLALASRLIAEVRSMGETDDTLSDLGLVIDGFLGLSRAAAPPPAPAAAETLSAPAAGTAAGAGPPASMQGPAPMAAVAGVHSGPATNRLVLPVVVRQPAPELPLSLAQLMTGTGRRNLILTVVINERGDVDDVEVVQPVQPAYDSVAVRAARLWKYRPATFDGTPVKYRKTVSFELAER